MSDLLVLVSGLLAIGILWGFFYISKRYRARSEDYHNRFDYYNRRGWDTSKVKKKGYFE